MENWVSRLSQNLLARELGLVALLVLAIVVYYFRYVHAARTLRGRRQRGQLTRLISGTRFFMVVVAMALVAVLAYDRVWPHLAPRFQPRAAVSSSHAAPASTAKAGATTATSSQASTSAQTASAATSVSETAQARAAVQLVNDYYSQHADELSDALVVYQFLGETTGRAGITVQRVGGFVKHGTKLTQTYEFWVYPGDQFDRQTHF
ncbi:hypothetical protein [Lacticaseibacillus daqingensis]|uniref:hypothetical protein n=1 Tax=Lacticaseibacillus daqingensis TaxID=2486014 RepID=UPI000F7AB10A|nr:hypothetical protein [Lacticaseibacillus daqingensis]